MRGVRIITIRCVACQHYLEDGILKRCTYPDNLYTNWLGTAYTEHPTAKNRKGDCHEFQKIDEPNNIKSTTDSSRIDDISEDGSFRSRY